MNLIRDRIRELRRVRADSLRANPRNWRKHPTQQRSAMARVLEEVGYADALIVRELTDGALEILDGHLRAETTPDVEVPVLVVDLNDCEAAVVLATHDPLAAMAESDGRLLQELLQSAELQIAAMNDVFARLTGTKDELPTLPDVEPPTLEALWQVVVDCRDETEQRELFDRLTAENRRCRLLVI